MQSSQNLPVVEAKQEYTNVLKDAVVDVISEKFVSMYKECLNENSKEPILVRYMQKLKEVLDWSPAYIDIHLTKIKRNCAWFNELLTAVIVTNVKILTSVKVNKNKKKVQLKMPDCEKFVHQIFINSAKKLYNNIQKTKQFKHDNETFMTSIILSSIDDTIRNQIPIQNILKNMLEEESESDKEFDKESDKELGEDNELDKESDKESDNEFGEGDNEPLGEGDNEPLDEGDNEPLDEGDNEPLGEGDNEPLGEGDNEPSSEGPKPSFFDPPPSEVKHIPINQTLEKKPKFMFDDAAEDPPED